MHYLKHRFYSILLRGKYVFSSLVQNGVAFEAFCENAGGIDKL